MCELGGVKAVRAANRADSAVSVDEFQDCEEGDDDGERRPRPVFRKELGEDAEKIDVVVEVHDSDDNVSVKGEKEKGQVHDSEDSVPAGASVDSEDGVPAGAPAVDEDRVPASESVDSEDGVQAPVDSVDGVPAEAPVGSGDGARAEAPVGSGDSALVGDGEKGVSAGDSVWEEVRKVKNGSFILEQGPRSPVF